MADAKNDKASTELRKAQQAQDGRKAMQDYEAEAAALRAKTEKLRAARLAREAAAPPAPVRASPAKAGRKTSKSAKAKARPLSDWLDDQRKDGRHD